MFWVTHHTLDSFYQNIPGLIRIKQKIILLYYILLILSIEKVYCLKAGQWRGGGGWKSTCCYNTNSPEKQLTKNNLFNPSTKLASSHHRPAIVCTSWGGLTMKELPRATEVPCHTAPQQGCCMDACFPTHPAVCDMEIQDVSLQDYSSGTC